MVGEEISEAARKARFEQWEIYGVDRLKSDLQTDPYRRVGSGAIQQLAWEFVRMKEAHAQAATQEQPPELFTLKPNFHGIGIDLKEAGRRIHGLFQGPGSRR